MDQSETTKTVTPGITGWLAFSCFSIGVSIALNTWQLYEELRISSNTIGDQLRNLLLFEFWLFPFIIVSGIVALITILMKKQAGKYWAVTLYASVVIGGIIIVVLSNEASLVGDLQITNGEIRGVVTSAAWLAYYLKSKQVALTLVG